MRPEMAYAVIAVGAYLLGSIPTGFLAGKACGIDVRKHGSGNIGATNALRLLGKPIGITVLVIDGLKGYAACGWLAPLLARATEAAIDLEVGQIVAGFAVVLGHNFTCWLRFKGGKGIATSAGVLAALVPWALIIVLALWIVLFLTTRYVSVASIAASAALPLATWFTTRSVTLTVVTGLMAAMAIYKHKGNIQRLLAGTENRIAWKRTEVAR